MPRRKVTRGSPPRLAPSRRRGRADSPVANEAPRRARTDGEGEGTLGVYFREMSELDVMSAEEEHAAAIRISRLRAESWQLLLNYPPFVDAIVSVVEDKIDEETLPRALTKAMQKAGRSLRDRETKQNKDAYAHASQRLAEALGYIDTDGLIFDPLVADLDAFAAGHRSGALLAVHPPRRGSRPFMQYVTRVQAAGMALRAAKNVFVKKNLRLVVSIARRFNHGRMPLQDLIQEGNIGLMKAVDRFDHRRGFRFSTYGSWWIRHAISRAIADKARAVRLPVHMIDAHQKVSKARRELETLHGREPTAEELAEHTGLALAKIVRMDMLPVDHPISLERRVSGEDDRTLVDFLEDENASVPGDTLEAAAINDHVRQVIRDLRPIEADILRKRFGLSDDDKELTLKEIGERYSLSRERIRQLQEQALGKVRRELLRRDAV